MVEKPSCVYVSTFSGSNLDMRTDTNAP